MGAKRTCNWTAAATSCVDILDRASHRFAISVKASGGPDALHAKAPERER